MFYGIGTLANVTAILFGGTLGLLMKKSLPQNMGDTVNDAVGVSVIVIGVLGAVTAAIKSAQDGTLNAEYTLLMVISLALGTLLGALLKLDERINRFAEKVGSRLSKNDASVFSAGFINASLIFCVGAMAIVGSIEDGMMGNPQTLFVKALLDGITAMVLAASLGGGVLLSGLPVFLYQGAITALAVFLKDFVPQVLVTQLSLVGNVLILCIGFNICGIKRFKVASMLPAVLVPIAYAVIRLIF